MQRDKIAAYLAAIEVLAGCVRDEVLGQPAVASDPVAVGCPHCGEAERLEDTSDSQGARTTCLNPNCGKSWRQ
jgi:hypothetical protein